VIRTSFVAVVVSLFLCTLPGNSAEPGKALKIGPRNAKLLENLGIYPDLEVLSISCLENLRSLPDSIGKLTKLKELIIDNGNGCAMNPLLPEALGNLRVLEKLVLYGAQDPRGTGSHPGPQPGKRHQFPRSMSQLKNLVYLDLGRNELDEIPPFVQDLPKLKELGFAWNMKLKAIPEFLTNLRELTTLKLDANDLNDLPDFLNKLPKLSRITLGDNCKITQNHAKMRDLKRRFPKVTFDFDDEYDCP